MWLCMSPEVMRFPLMDFLRILSPSEVGLSLQLFSHMVKSHWLSHMAVNINIGLPQAKFILVIYTLPLTRFNYMIFVLMEEGKHKRGKRGHSEPSLQGLSQGKKPKSQ